MAEEGLNICCFARAGIAEYCIEWFLRVHVPISDLWTVAIDIELGILIEHIAAWDATSKAVWHGYLLFVLKA